MNIETKTVLQLTYSII